VAETADAAVLTSYAGDYARARLSVLEGTSYKVERNDVGACARCLWLVSEA
jgi:hypothetical protein